MASITTPHAAKVGVRFTTPASLVVCENTFAVMDPTDNLFSDPGGFQTQVWNAVVANLVPACTGEVVFNGIIFEDVRSIPYGGATYDHAGTPGTASAPSAPLATSTALSIKKVTGALGRSGRGRWYWPVWDIAEIDSTNVVKSAKVAAYVAALQAFQAAVEGGTYPCQVGIISEQSGGVPRANGVFYQIVDWVAFDPSVDNQRRRLTGRGQ